jgi:sulfoxide reductase catalytic subunit YedY
MLIKRRRGWELSESDATPEQVFCDRRAFMAGAAAAGATLLAPGRGRAADAIDPTASLYPAKRNEAFKPGRDITPFEVNSKFNNFYEFGSAKEISEAAELLTIRPWSIKITGMVEKPQEISFDDLIRKMALEERVVRHRCVEAWAMVVPWTGFPLKDLVKLAAPLGSAKYVRMETFMAPDVAHGQLQDWYPWPYVEGLTMAEASNDLAFMVTGAYGKPLAKSFGAPIRLHTPWKYGFKSIKSVTKIEFTDQRPKTFWETIQSSEYGFWANVNPQVPHPRWSQASERILGTGTWWSAESQPTKLFNGYGEFVADLYKGLETERLYV